ncbi:DinB family protein [Virgisporangium aliadipatigenens]|uniref:DinB family protein n=1 Tax=Virgisporangium aliadipatigenens TaxID=741659 RepID=UPI001943836A|nr:DinB family protein [Virgisporangium aliadipatigenens]
MTIEWNPLLLEQLTWHWEFHLRPRLNGLDDDEYFWEPAPNAWSVRPRGVTDPRFAIGDKDFTVDFVTPEPTPPPVTTIAWRLAHLIVGVLGERTANHFDGPDIRYPTFAYAGTAKEALQQLDDGYERWVAGVRGLGEEGLERPCGPAEGPYAKHPLAALVVHISREVIHHGAEILLLRDLYRSR